MDVPGPCSFVTGESFLSFALLDGKIEKYKAEQHCELYIWDSVTIKTAVKRGIKIPIIPQLKYYLIKYACVRGGKKFGKREKGLRNTRYILFHLFYLATPNKFYGLRPKGPFF